MAASECSISVPPENKTNGSIVESIVDTAKYESMVKIE